MEFELKTTFNFSNPVLWSFSCLCKEQMKKETSLKNEALREKAFIQQKLNSKSEVTIMYTI